MLSFAKKLWSHNPRTGDGPGRQGSVNSDVRTPSTNDAANRKIVTASAETERRPTQPATLVVDTSRQPVQQSTSGPDVVDGMTVEATRTESVETTKTSTATRSRTSFIRQVSLPSTVDHQAVAAVGSTSSTSSSPQQQIFWPIQHQQQQNVSTRRGSSSNLQEVETAAQKLTKRTQKATHKENRRYQRRWQTTEVQLSDINVAQEQHTQTSTVTTTSTVQFGGLLRPSGSETRLDVSAGKPSSGHSEWRVGSLKRRSDNALTPTSPRPCLDNCVIVGVVSLIQESTEFEIVSANDRILPQSANYLDITSDRLQSSTRCFAIIRPTSSSSRHRVFHGSRDSLNAVDQGSTADDSVCSLNCSVQLTRDRTVDSRHLFLFTNHLLIAKQSSIGNSNVFKLKKRVSVNDLWMSSCVDDVDDSMDSLSSKSLMIGWPPHVNYIAVFKSETKKNQWFEALNKQKQLQQPRSGILKVVNNERNYAATKSFIVQDSDDATKVVQRCLQEFHFSDADPKHYQLIVRTNKDDRSYPLIGHEHPLAICLYDRKNAAGSSAQIQPKSSGNNSQTQEKESVPTINSHYLELCVKKPNIRTADKVSGPRRQRTPLGNLFRRPPQQRTFPDSAAVTPGRVFGRPLHVICADGSIPKPIMDILQYLYDNGPLTQGIFRTSGSFKQRQNLRAQLDAGDEWDVSEVQVHSAASTLKEFLRALPDSLLVCDFYQIWIDIMLTPDIVERSKKISRQVMLMPDANLLMLCHLLCVLCRIARHSAENQMTSTNLAVCIAPSVLWPRGSTTSAMDDLKLQHHVCQLVDHLITHAAEIWPRPEDCLELFEPSGLASAVPHSMSASLSDSEEEFNEQLLGKSPYADDTLLGNDSDADISHDLSPSSRDSGCALSTRYIYRSSSTEDEGPISDKMPRLPDILEGQVRIPKTTGNVRDRITGLYKMSKTNSDDSALCQSSLDDRSYPDLSEPESENDITDGANIVTASEITTQPHQPLLVKSTDLRLGQHPLGVIDVTQQSRDPITVATLQVPENRSSVEQDIGRTSPSGVDLLFRVLDDKSQQNSTPKQRDSAVQDGLTVKTRIKSLYPPECSSLENTLKAPALVDATRAMSLYPAASSQQINNSNRSTANLSTVTSLVNNRLRRSGSGSIKSDNHSLSGRPPTSDGSSHETRGTSSRAHHIDSIRAANKPTIRIRRTDTTKSDSKPVSTRPRRTDSAKSDNRLLSVTVRRNSSAKLSDMPLLSRGPSQPDVTNGAKREVSALNRISQTGHKFEESVTSLAEHRLATKQATSRSAQSQSQQGSVAKPHSGHVDSAAETHQQPLRNFRPANAQTQSTPKHSQLPDHKQRLRQTDATPAENFQSVSKPAAQKAREVAPAVSQVTQQGSKAVNNLAPSTTGHVTSQQRTRDTVDSAANSTPKNHSSAVLTEKVTSTGGERLNQKRTTASNVEQKPRDEQQMAIQPTAYSTNSQRPINVDSDVPSYSYVQRRAVPLPNWQPLNQPTATPERVTLNETSALGDRTHMFGSSTMLNVAHSDNMTTELVVSRNAIGADNSMSCKVAPMPTEHVASHVRRPQVTVVTVAGNCTIISNCEDAVNPANGCTTSPMPRGKLYSNNNNIVARQQTDIKDTVEHRRQLPRTPVAATSSDTNPGPSARLNVVAKLRSVYEDKPHHSADGQSPVQRCYNVSLNLK